MCLYFIKQGCKQLLLIDVGNSGSPATIKINHLIWLQLLTAQKCKGIEDRVVKRGVTLPSH